MDENLRVISTDQLQLLAKTILDVVNTRIEERKVTQVNSASDDMHMPSAKAVYNSINNIQNVIILTIASGDPEEAEVDKNSKTLYVVRTSVNSTTYVPYIWTPEQGFISASGSTTEDNSDIAALTDAEVVSAVNAAADQTKVL